MTMDFENKESVENFLNITRRVALNMVGPKMWGLHPENGYVRPQIVEYNGEWYIKVKEDNEYFQEPYYDYEKDIESGLYVPTGVKVGEKNIYERQK